MKKLVCIAWTISCVVFAADPVATDDVLRLTGKSLQAFWERLANVDCMENVQQQKLGPGGKALFHQDSSFDYLVSLQLTGNDVLVDESRVPIGKAADAKNVSLLLTNGFSTLSFIFHPAFQSAFEYSGARPADLDGKRLLAVDFRHIRGARSPSLLKLKSRDYPLDWQGTAWIEPASGAIVRISASLMPGLEELGIKTMVADVRSTPVKFKDQTDPWWLPETATIEVETARQHWRNVHTFSRYRVFGVEVSTKMEIPK